MNASKHLCYLIVYNTYRHHAASSILQLFAIWDVMISMQQSLIFADIASGPVAQWIRHRPTEPGIAGSSPAGVICMSIASISLRLLFEWPHFLNHRGKTNRLVKAHRTKAASRAAPWAWRMQIEKKTQSESSRSQEENKAQHLRPEWRVEHEHRSIFAANRNCKYTQPGSNWRSSAC